MNFVYLNTNPVIKKFENFKEIITENVNIFTIAKIKPDGSCSTSQFQLKGYYSQFHLDITNQSGGLLGYVKSPSPSRQLFN